MPAEPAVKFEALERQAQALMAVYTKAGHEAVAPAVIQPAEVFLDTIGEALRARTYVFSDPDGAELCLRPDLTLPTCRLHIARHANPATEARYCYNGPAFRFQPQGADATHPREFRQAGIERFGEADRETAEAETIALLLKSLEATGLNDWSLRIGDLGLFRAVLAAADLNDRMKARLSDAFWRPAGFRAELKRLCSGRIAPPASVPQDLLASVEGNTGTAVESRVAAYFDANGIELVGTRTLAEIAARLVDIAADAAAEPLARSAAVLIESYIAIAGPAADAGTKVAGLLKGAKSGTAQALAAYDRRLACLANLGVDLGRVSFSAEFGRNLEYYTGLVFEVTAPGLRPASPVAGGGRYDGLMRAAGSATDVPAVGAAVHTERLLQVATGGRR